MSGWFLGRQPLKCLPFNSQEVINIKFLFTIYQYIVKQTGDENNKNRHSWECMQVKSLLKERQVKICLLLKIVHLSQVPLFILIKEIKVAMWQLKSEVDYERVPI